MDKIILNDGASYNVITCGATPEYLEIEIAEGQYDLLELINKFTNIEATKEIKLYNEDGDLIRSPYLNYTKFFKVQYIEANYEFNPNDISRYEVTLYYQTPKYATEEELEIISDAIAELAALITEGEE